MTTSPNPNRPSRSATEVKLLITAASLAATLGGWVILARAEKLPVAQARTTAPAQSSGRSVASNPAQPGPTLRVVTAPPAPVAITRSSR